MAKNACFLSTNKIARDTLRTNTSLAFCLLEVPYLTYLA